MSTLRIAFIYLYLLTGACGVYAQGHQWTLQECIDYATIHNVSVKRTIAQGEIAEANLLQQKAGWYPTLNANVSQSVTYRPFMEGTTGFINGNTMSSSANKTSYNGSYGINSTWTVFNGNQTANNIKIAKGEKELSALQTEININSLKEQIIQLYINIMYTKEALKVNRELLKQDEILYSRGKELLVQGQIAKYELLELQSLVANGKYDTVNTMTQINQYKLQLKQLMYFPADDDIVLATLDADDAYALATVSETNSIYERAISLRPEIKSADINITQSELNYKIAKAAYLPTISMSAGFGDNHSSGVNKDWFEQMKRNLDGSLGVTVSVPIFDGRRNKTNVQKAKTENFIASLDKNDAESTLYYTIANYRLNAYNNQQKFIAGKEKENYNQANYDAIFEKATIGTMNIVETMNARASLLNAKQDVLQSKYATIYNMEILNLYAGKEINIK